MLSSTRSLICRILQRRPTLTGSAADATRSQLRLAAQASPAAHGSSPQHLTTVLHRQVQPGVHTKAAPAAAVHHPASNP